MVATGYASKPPKSQVTTVLPGENGEEQFKNVQFKEWVESKGGYDKVYAAWRKHAIQTEALSPWGGAG